MFNAINIIAVLWPQLVSPHWNHMYRG